jgi:hypothetical protein
MISSSGSAAPRCERHRIVSHISDTGVLSWLVKNSARIVLVGSAERRGTSLGWSFSAQPFFKPDGVAVAADHERLAAGLGHDLGPSGLQLAGPAEVGERTDMVNLNVIRSPADLASALEQPGDQLAVRVDRPGVPAVGEDRSFLPFERDTAEPCDQ